MRILVHAKFPHEPFNTLAKSGQAGQKIQQILGEIKPEAVYFTEYDGKRGAVLIVNIEKASQVPSIAEPLFLTFNADTEFHLVMSPEDLAASGLDDIGKKWA